MPRDGAIIFADLIGKLDLLRVACDKCGKAGGPHSATYGTPVACAANDNGGSRRQKRLANIS
jgi:hypothetical protein